jgi:sugar lactone lactonase YvrE
MVPDATVDNMTVDKDGTVYVLAQKGQPIDYNDIKDIHRKRPTELFR